MVRGRAGDPAVSRPTDALRLAVGTLTAFRVPPPRVVDRTTGARAMTLAPLVGLLLAVPSGVLLLLLEGRAAPTTRAAARVGALAWSTRAMHLDGLADTADGLGSGRPAEEALAIMRRSDIGPFGVVTLLVTLLVEVAALAQLADEGRGVLAVVVALVGSRLVLPLACSRGVHAARPDGLGQLVANSVSRSQVAGAALLAVLATAAAWLAVDRLGAADTGLGGLETFPVVAAVLAVALGQVAGSLLLARCVRRLGGVTGDVLGACVEVACAAILVVLALAPA